MKRDEQLGVGALFGEQLDNDVAPLVAAAHELKTPLSVIAYLAAALRDPAANLPAKTQRQYLERISLATERMNRLVEGFTQAYRLSSDPRQLSLLGLEPIDAALVSSEVAHELQPLADQLDQQLEIEIGSRSSLVVANRQLLTSVLTNLIDNALKHNPVGSRVVVRLSQRGTQVRTEVRDNGTAVNRHDLRRLQASLGRELQPLSGRSHSSGLGLYIAAQLTRAMGGELGAVCHHRAGVTFYADLQRSRQLSFL